MSAVGPALDKRLVLDGWEAAFKRALDADTWGQSIEAHDEYGVLAHTMQRELPLLALSVDERGLARKALQTVRLRAIGLTDVTGTKGVGLAEAKQLQCVWASMFRGAPVSSFPFDLAPYAQQLAGGGDEVRETGVESECVAGSDGGGDVGGDGSDAGGAGPGSSAMSGGGRWNAQLPPLIVTQSGTTTLSVRLEKIGLKDATSYIEPRLTVTVVDERGVARGVGQDLPPAGGVRGSHIEFGSTVHLQTPWSELAPGWAVFFEFKHYKPKKRKVSTRCFAFLEYDEMREGVDSDMVLELYTKPTDFTKRRIRLHTRKPLYLHVRLQFERH